MEKVGQNIWCQKKSLIQGHINDNFIGLDHIFYYLKNAKQEQNLANQQRIFRPRTVCFLDGKTPIFVNYADHASLC